jgi:hypothetical protein
MGFFSSRPTCRKFFTYETRTLDIKGLSAGISPSELGGIDFTLGQFRLSPEFVKVSEMLMRMDLQQYDLCQTISNISDRNERDRMFIQLAGIKMEMLRMAAHPEAYENRTSNPVQRDAQADAAEERATAAASQPGTHSGSNIMQLLDNPATIGDALIEAAKLPFRGDDKVRFEQKRLRYIDGLRDHERPVWVGEMKNFLAQYL